jgi:hypothetical protein
MTAFQNAANDALMVQNACNLSGVVNSWGKAVTAIWDEAREGQMRGTDWVNRHPINVLFAAKATELSGGSPMAIDDYSAATKACWAIAKGGTLHA